MKSTDKLITGKKEKKDFRKFLKSERKKQGGDTLQDGEGGEASLHISDKKSVNQRNQKKLRFLKKNGSSYGKKEREALKREKKEQNLALNSLIGKQSIVNRLQETRTKIVLTVLVPVIFMAVYGYVSYNKSSSAIIGSYESNISRTVEAVSSYLDLGLGTVQDKAVEILLSKAVANYYVRLNKDDTIDDYKNLKTLQQEVMVINQTNLFVSDAYLFADVGRPVLTKGTAVADLYDLYIASDEGKAIVGSKKTNQWVGSHPFLDETLTLDSTKYATAIVAKMSTIDGLVILDVSRKEVVNSLKNVTSVDGSIAAFITANGNETNTTESGEVVFTGSDFYQKTADSGEHDGFKYVDYNGGQYLYVFNSVGETGSMVCALIPKAEILSQAKALKNLNVAFVFVSSILAIFIGYIIAMGIGRTIRRLMISISKAASGDLTVEFDTTRKDEFGILSKSLHNMTAGMKQLIGEVYQVGDKVTRSSAVLSQTSDQILTSTKGISLTIDEIEGGVVQQADDTEKCLGQMARLSDQISQVYSNTYEIEKKATDTKSIIGEGIVTIDELGQKAKATSEVTQTVIRSIEELEVKSRSIVNFVGIINEIAAQTNLLSLNASIEAARAGEAGRGFAVVADEIRKLADQSVDAVKQIQDIVKDIQNKTQGTVASAKEAGEIVESQTTALKKTVTTFEKINTYVGGLVSNLDNISTGVKGIESAKEDTLDAIRSISAVSQETAAASEEVSATANAQIGAVENLSRSATELEEDAKNLEKAIKLFKIQ